jgi:hypothetical protein
MTTPPETSATFQVDCDGDPLYKELYERAKASGGGEMQPLASMVVEITMVPKEPTDTSQSK